MSELLPIEPQLFSRFPINWRLTAIILDLNNLTWQVTAWTEDLTHAVMKSANTIDEALKLTEIAIYQNDYWSPSASRSRLATAAGDLLSILGLGKAKPAEPVKRRVIP